MEFSWPALRCRAAAFGMAAAGAVVAGFGLATVSLSATAADGDGPGIYSCIDANGKKITSDRPVVNCANRDQRVLNPDGSLRKIVPPRPTLDETTEMEAQERKAAVDRAAMQDAIRRDRNLLHRYPDEAAHQRAREAAMDDVKKAIRVSEERVAHLQAERKPLVEEAEFYKNKPLPLKLKLALDANDAAFEAQSTMVQNQQAELDRIDALYDIELARLRKLWAGAPPGSMGILNDPPAGGQPSGKPAAKPTT